MFQGCFEFFVCFRVFLECLPAECGVYCLSHGCCACYGAVWVPVDAAASLDDDLIAKSLQQRGNQRGVQSAGSNWKNRFEVAQWSFACVDVFEDFRFGFAHFAYDCADVELINAYDACHLGYGAHGYSVDLAFGEGCVPRPMCVDNHWKV